MRDPECLERLSADGRARLEATRARLDAAFAARAEASFARWVERTWRALDGPACLDREDELRTAELVFALLAREERLGDLDDPARLGDAFEAQQPQGDPPRGHGIEIMTMHRAKGLEFDTVIALGLGRDPPSDDKRPLHWLERAAADGSKDLLLAPTLADEDSERLTDFVRRADRERERAERARLLYVAATRARDRLHLVWQLSASRSEPKPGSLLSCLWDTLDPATVVAVAGDAAAKTAEQDALEPVLRRLADVALPRDLERSRQQAPMRPPPREQKPTPALGMPQLALPFESERLPSSELDAATVEPARPEFVWAGRAAAHVGTVVHRHLQRIAERRHRFRERGIDRAAHGCIRAGAAAARRRGGRDRTRDRAHRRGAARRARRPRTAASCSAPTKRRARSSR